MILKAPVKGASLQDTHDDISKHKIHKVFKGLDIIYFVTHGVILVISVNSKSIHQLKQNL